MSERRSVSFDRVAEIYDATRLVEPDVLAAMLDGMGAEFAGQGRILEIGVGTGALALPMWERGIPVVGLDLSSAMMARLVRKAGGESPVPLVQGDASRLPFRDGALGGAYGRHVLHLIPNWRRVIQELVRVVRSGGTVVIEHGGFTGEWRELWERFRQELGPAIDPVGFDANGHPEELEEAFREVGAVPRDLPAVSITDSESIEEFLQGTEQRTYSWTWPIEEDRLLPAVQAVRAWAGDRFGDLTAEVERELPIQWRAFDVP